MCVHCIVYFCGRVPEVMYADNQDILGELFVETMDTVSKVNKLMTLGILYCKVLYVISFIVSLGLVLESTGNEIPKMYSANL